MKCIRAVSWSVTCTEAATVGDGERVNVIVHVSFIQVTIMYRAENRAASEI